MNRLLTLTDWLVKCLAWMSLLELCEVFCLDRSSRNYVMAISIILISSDSFEESVWTSSGQVLSFDHIPPLPATSPFLSSTDDSSNSDTPDTPPSPTHMIPPVEVAPPSSRILPTSPSVRGRRVLIVSPGQTIPYGRSYRYHPNGPVHMMTARKRVGPLLTLCLAVRHSVDYSSSNHFTLDDSSRDSSSSSSSETTSDSSSDALSDSSSSHLSSDHSLSSLSSERPYRKSSRSPTTSVPVFSPIPGAMSYVQADLLPPRKRIMSSDFVADLEDCSDESSESPVPRETSLRVDVDVKGSDESHSEHDIDPEIQAQIDECIAYADTLRARGIDARVVVETVAREEVETVTRGTVVVSDDRVTHPVVPDDILEPT
ncbi:hypothetical protein Tco_1018904 [Tanacetum coccineum]|uniref:Uncharacterized protein n=1 Tax=Tanacetum coccineum TaxID=301880 RepID=A0ABQ5FW64_9ASTR